MKNKPVRWDLWKKLREASSFFIFVFSLAPPPLSGCRKLVVGSRDFFFVDPWLCAAFSAASTQLSDIKQAILSIFSCRRRAFRRYSPGECSGILFYEYFVLSIVIYWELLEKWQTPRTSKVIVGEKRIFGPDTCGDGGCTYFEKGQFCP